MAQGLLELVEGAPSWLRGAIGASRRCDGHALPRVRFQSDANRQVVTHSVEAGSASIRGGAHDEGDATCARKHSDSPRMSCSANDRVFVRASNVVANVNEGVLVCAP